jgi:hypothetical protein
MAIFNKQIIFHLKKGASMLKKIFLFTFITLVSLSTIGCGRGVKLGAGEAGYVSKDFMFGKKNVPLMDPIMIGPNSTGLCWRDHNFLGRVSLRPQTIKEEFERVNETTDKRILSKDKINLDISSAVVIGFRNAPGSPQGYQPAKLKKALLIHFAQYGNKFWSNQFKEPFRAYIRERIGKEDYETAKKDRVVIANEAKAWVDDKFSNTPYYCKIVTISNINPPQRILEQEEISRSIKIREDNQNKFAALEKKKSNALTQKASNYAAATRLCPRLLDFLILEVQEQQVENMKVALTGENASSIQKIFIPYGTGVVSQDK